MAIRTRLIAALGRRISARGLGTSFVLEVFNVINSTDNVVNGSDNVVATLKV